MTLNVLEYLEESARRVPSRMAVVAEDQSLTYAQLRERSRQLAARLPGPGRPVAVYLPKGARALVAMMGALQAGNFYVPLDVRSPPRRTEAILANLEPAAVVTTSELVPAVQRLVPHHVPVLLADAPEAPPSVLESLVQRQAAVLDTDPAYVIYTSGSTGVPKGVVITHRGIADYIEWACDTFGLDEALVVANQSPFHFDNSTLDIYTVLRCGGTMHVLPEGTFSFPLRLMEEVARREVTFVFWVPSVMIAVANADVLQHVPLPRLRHVLFAGEVMPARHLNHWRKHVAHPTYANLYGPTEITVDCTYHVVQGFLGDDEPVPIGRPRRNMDALVVREDGQAAGPGETGELWVRGSALALGYWGDEAKTAAVFVQNPFHRRYQDRCYRTGDLVYRDARGELIFVGRRDNQVKLFGHRIELGEVETAALGIEGIGSACALLDSERQQLVLFCVLLPPLDVAGVRRSLSERLPKYMVPARYIPMERLPLNANGKVDRQELARQLEAPVARGAS